MHELSFQANPRCHIGSVRHRFETFDVSSLRCFVSFDYFYKDWSTLHLWPHSEPNTCFIAESPTQGLRTLDFLTWPQGMIKNDLQVIKRKSEGSQCVFKLWPWYDAWPAGPVSIVDWLKAISKGISSMAPRDLGSCGQCEIKPQFKIGHI